MLGVHIKELQVIAEFRVPAAEANRDPHWMDLLRKMNSDGLTPRINTGNEWIAVARDLEQYADICCLWLVNMLRIPGHIVLSRTWYLFSRIQHDGGQPYCLALESCPFYGFAVSFRPFRVNVLLQNETEFVQIVYQILLDFSRIGIKQQRRDVGRYKVI